MPNYLPFDSEDPNQTHRVQLEDSVFDINFRWSSTECAWYCLIGPNAEDPVTKFKLLCGVDLLRVSKAYDGVPSGSLFLTDRDWGTGRPSRNDIGSDKRFRLLYFEEDELL